jgi:phosphopantothenoylcysteine decarboxylase/phosphopantothenate--cysteine ligase
MFAEVKGALARNDLFFSVAAVADYTPVARSGTKIKKSREAMTLELKPTEDILAWVAAQPGAPFCVGFAAESENLAGFAQAKREKKKLPMIVANLVQDAIGKDENEVTVYDGAGAHPFGRAAKPVIARRLLEHACALMDARHGGANVKPFKQAS